MKSRSASHHPVCDLKAAGGYLLHRAMVPGRATVRIARRAEILSFGVVQNGEQLASVFTWAARPRSEMATTYSKLYAHKMLRAPRWCCRFGGRKSLLRTKGKVSRRSSAPA